MRKEALEWYTRFAGGDALELLISYAADEGVYGSLFVERLHLQRTAFRLICEKFPEKAVEIAKACMLSGDVVSDSAVHFLMENDDHHRYVAEKFSNIAAVNGRLLAIQLFLRLSGPIGRPVFIDGLKDTSVSIATFSVQGVEKFDLESELPTASREALEKWRTIPHFQLRMTAESSHQNEGKTASILSAIENVDESDPFASRIYFEAWRMLSAESRNITMAGILRCVDNYKASG